MRFVILDKSHIASANALFITPKYMGVNLDQHNLGGIKNAEIQNKVLFGRFIDTYLSGLKSFQAIGAYDDEDKKFTRMLGFMSFYEDVHEPSWYMTMCRNNGDRKVMMGVLDNVIEHNEANGRFKFYTLMNSRHAKVIRKVSWSEYNNERYDYFDEYVVPAKTRCLYYTVWETMFKRTLLPVDTILRCSFLKQKYRSPLTIGGGVVNAEEQYIESDSLDVINNQCVDNVLNPDSVVNNG